VCSNTETIEYCILIYCGFHIFVCNFPVLYRCTVNYMYTYIHIYIYTYIHIYIYTYIHIYIYTYIHVYLYTYIHRYTKCVAVLKVFTAAFWYTVVGYIFIRYSICNALALNLKPQTYMFYVSNI